MVIKRLRYFFVLDTIRNEARYTLGCDNVEVTPYGKYVLDHLEVRLVNLSSGNLNYSA